MALAPENSMKWNAVPDEKFAEWQAAFRGGGTGIRVLGACPLCHAAGLFQWHDGRRALWQWCIGCHTYQHYQALVPDGWNPEVAVSPINATVEPTAIIEALREAKFSKC
jgi:hypothetical protein